MGKQKRDQISKWSEIDNLGTLAIKEDELLEPVVSNELLEDQEEDLLTYGTKLADQYIPPGNKNDIDLICDPLPDTITIDEVLQHPTLPDIDKSQEDRDQYLSRFVDAVNGSNKPKVITSLIGRPIGHVVPPGCIGVVRNYKGHVMAIKPGVWYLMPRHHYVGTYRFDTEKYHYETLTIVRVPYGQYGLAKMRGVPILLAEGLHIYNDRQFQFEQCVNIDSECISHANLHVIRVPDAHLGAIKYGKDRLLLKPGTYCVRSPLFQFNKMVETGNQYIHWGRRHVVRVTKGNCALVTLEGKPMLLGQQGLYVFRSNAFAYYKMVSLTVKDIIHEAIKIITVDAGFVGVTFNGGELNVLEPGRHAINDPKTEFVGFLSTQSQSLSLGMANERDKGLDLETDNFAKITVWAEAYYRIDGIDGARKALQTLGRQESIMNHVRQNAISTLAAIVRETSLIGMWQQKLAKQKKVMEEDNADVATGVPGKSTFGLYNKENNQHLAKLFDEFSEEHGIIIKSIRIKDIDIQDKKFAAAINNLTMQFSEIQIKMATAENEKRVAVAEQDRKREVQLIEAQTVAEVMRHKAEAKRMEAEVQKQTKLLVAQADAEAEIVKARAEADSQRMRTQAEADAIRSRGDAEAERAQKLTSIKGAVDMSNLEKIMDGYARAFGNTEKMIIPSEAGNNPWMALMGAATGFFQPHSQKLTQIAATTTE